MQVLGQSRTVQTVPYAHVGYTAAAGMASTSLTVVLSLLVGAVFAFAMDRLRREKDRRWPHWRPLWMALLFLAILLALLVPMFLPAGGASAP